MIDPFGGAADLAAGVLRHVSPAFAEDPLRVLRVARFAARFGFAVAPETEAMMRALAAGGELALLSPERVWQELARGLMEPQPSRMLAVLRDCGALAQVLPEVDALYGVPQPVAHHPELDTGVHVALALDYAAAKGFALPVRYAVLAHDLGKADDRGRRVARAPRARSRAASGSPAGCRRGSGARRLPGCRAARGALARNDPSRRTSCGRRRCSTSSPRSTRCAVPSGSTRCSRRASAMRCRGPGTARGDYAPAAIVRAALRRRAACGSTAVAREA